MREGICFNFLDVKSKISKTTFTLVIACIFCQVSGQFDASFLDSIVGVGLPGCQEACLRYASCRSFTYFRRKTFCSLWTQRVRVNSAQINIPGMVYRDGDLSPQVDLPRSCAGEFCPEGEVCRKNECTKITCSVPMVGSTTVLIVGNQLKIGSKILFECLNQFTETVNVKCDHDSLWSKVDFSCEVHGYDFVSDNRYGYSSDSTDRAVFSMTTPYLNVCIEKCNKTNDCSGVNYFHSTGNCSSTNYILLHGSGYFGVGWRYYRKVLPIILAEKIPNQWYAFSYKEGIKHCEKVMNTTIATLDDLILAYKMGYHRCSCGWVRGGHAYMSLVFKCGDQLGVRHCKTLKAHVFCKNAGFVST